MIRFINYVKFCQNLSLSGPKEEIFNKDRVLIGQISKTNNKEHIYFFSVMELNI